MTPSLFIVVQVEELPLVIIDALSELDERRLLDWLEQHPDLADHVRLAYMSAVDLMRATRRAA